MFCFCENSSPSKSMLMPSTPALRTKVIRFFTALVRKESLESIEEMAELLKQVAHSSTLTPFLWAWAMVADQVPGKPWLAEMLPSPAISALKQARWVIRS